jgi:hypothetical protein
VVLEHLHGAKGGAAGEHLMAEGALVVLLALVHLLVVLVRFAWRGGQRMRQGGEGGHGSPHILEFDGLEEGLILERVVGWMES